MFNLEVYDYLGMFTTDAGLKLFVTNQDDEEVGEKDNNMIDRKGKKKHIWSINDWKNGKKSPGLKSSQIFSTESYSVVIIIFYYGLHFDLVWASSYGKIKLEFGLIRGRFGLGPLPGHAGTKSDSY